MLPTQGKIYVIYGLLSSAKIILQCCKQKLRSFILRRSQVVCKAGRKQLIYLSVEINLHNSQSFPFNIHQSWGPELMEESLTECEQEFLLDFLRKL